jgi:uncharacterized membrane protein (DUF106 family)
VVTKISATDLPIYAIIPISTIVVMLICVAISFTSSSINRLLISRFVGWEQYRMNQKEIAEYQSDMRKALRANDKKAVEKLKKKESQVLNMQKKMVKPQLVLFVLSFSYIFIWWFVLTPVYGADTLAYVPGFGPIGVLFWYMICSFFFGTLASRVLGILQIE